MAKAKREPVWTAERTEILVNMWAQGLGSGAIARVLGVVSRNAVMGKVDRLGLMGKAGKRPGPVAARPAPVEVPARSSRAPAPSTKIIPVTAAARTPKARRGPPAVSREEARSATLDLLRRMTGSPRQAVEPVTPVAEPEAIPSSVPQAAAEVVAAIEALDASSGASVAERAAAERRAEVLRREAEEAAAQRAVARVAADARERERQASAAAERARLREEREPLGPEDDEGLGWVETAAPGAPVTLLRLRACMCRWPFGDPAKPGFRFCGAEAPEGKPYCAEHAAIAYEAPEVRTARKAAWTAERTIKARQNALQQMANRRPGRRSRKFASVAAE